VTEDVGRRDFFWKLAQKTCIMGVGAGTAVLSPPHALRVPVVEALVEEPPNDGRKNRNQKPFAPPNALLPATRLKLWFDSAYKLSSCLASADNKTEEKRILQEMNGILSPQPKLFLSGEKILKRTSNPTAQLTTGISGANKDQYQFNRKGLNPGDKIAAMLNQADVERQWGMLQYAESKREESNEMRAAFNYYTQQLSFGDDYVLTASPEERKKMIRNDDLPSITAVITSDLDLRDLYRNQFLTAVEDARAEVAYQATKVASVDEIDVLDTVDIMDRAFAAMNNWFGLIAPGDLEEAIHSCVVPV